MTKDKVKSKKSPLFVKASTFAGATADRSEGKKVKSKEEDGGSSKTSIKSSKQPQTMEELLAVTGYALKGVKKGDVVEGKILQVTSREVTIDVGSKAPGVVIDKELENYKDALMALKPGDSVVALVIVAENDRGQSVLSLRKYIFEKRWKMLAEYKKSGEPLEIVLKEPVRGGVLADYGGLRGYIPQSQLDSELAKQQGRATGRRIQVKVIEADQETNRLVFSQRALAEDAALVKQKEIVDAIPVGSTVTATITGVVPFGAFAKFTVDKDGKPQQAEGLIHISEIAWEKVGDPGQYLKTGESIKVKVVGVDKKTGKITLSVKQLLPDPWEDVLEIFEKDSQVKGTVSRVTPYGIFVTLSPGIEGLVHISKVAPGEEPKAGDEITCIVEDVRPEQHKISLSMTLTEKPIGYR